MSATNIRRVHRELSDLLKNDNPFNVQVIAVNHVTATINGPSDTPYAGGKFDVSIRIPANYPMVAPVVTFMTPVWHPNVASQRGIICLDVLDSRWSPIQSIRTILISLEGLLESPEPSDPLDAVVANQFVYNHALYVKTAEHWTNAYASGERVHADFDELVQRLLQFAGSDERARLALSCANWDIKAAAELLH